jgi:hypothetical protein
VITLSMEMTTAMKGSIRIGEWLQAGNVLGDSSCDDVTILAFGPK